MTDTKQPTRPFHRVRAVFVRLFGEPCRKQYVLWTLAVALWLGLFLGLLVAVPNIPKLVIAHTHHEFPTFSPDGKYLALTEGADQDYPDNYRLWNLETGQPGIAVPRRPFIFSPDGALLLVREKSGDLALWETATGKTVASIDCDTTVLELSGFSPDGRFVFLAFPQDDDTPPIERRYCLRLWDVKTKQVQRTFCNDRLPPVFSADGKHVACCQVNKRAGITKIEIWSLDDDLTASGPVKVHDIRADEIAFSPALDTFATIRRTSSGIGSATLEFWDLATGVNEGVVTEVGDSAIEHVQFSAHGRFATWSTGPRKPIGLWERPSSFKRLFSHPFEPVFSSDERWYLSTGNTHEPELYDSMTLQKRATLWREGDARPNYTYRLAPDSKTVLITGLTAPNPGNPVTDFLGQFVARFKPPASRQVARLWDVETATELATFDDCIGADYSPNGKMLLTVHEGGTVKLWDAQPRKPFLQIILAACVLWLMVLVGLQLWSWLIRWRSREIHPSALMNRSASIS